MNYRFFPKERDALPILGHNSQKVVFFSQTGVRASFTFLNA